MKKFWKNKRPSKGDIVEFVLNRGDRVIGYYLGIDSDMYYVASETFNGGDEFYILKTNAKYGLTIAKRHGMKPKKG